ncbi:Gfo/Idh/MocA family protein [Ectopseudomonas guguanensis]|uniref:Predicted dehydrogenase n=1 Tax=Ectopseudomonas guguanensis TaxID=1198456 RepID=A0A1H0XB60_9GAMM|nr:Gfo/Idh/MocA family oxidoreductase [Pseudomonas guguanensis]SDP99736.1 Predicted dehydrogenase [Pseudomonas guguanensis]
MKILFCGLGGIGQRHLRNLRQLLGDELQVHAYRVRGQRIKLRDNLTVDEGADLERDYAIVVHHDLAEALAEKPAAAFICNPNSLHVPVALECVRAGVAVFMEKPLASDLAGIGQLLAEVEQRRLPFHVGYNFRFHPGLQRIKGLLESGFFGRLLSVRSEIGEYLPNWHRYEDYRQMYAARADQGGGVILSQIHEMDLIYWFFGLPRSIVTHGGQLSHLEIDVEDTASSLMRCDGAMGSFPILLHQDYLQRPPVRCFKIVGDAGYAEIDLLANRLRVYGAEGELSEANDFPGFVRNDMFLAQARHFLDCVNGSATPQVSLHDGLQSLRLALAALRSLKEGREVALSEVNVHG